ncbi:MAG: hypothetical protein U0M60_18775 [Clostridia bacterium]|nr:hypothetical protein [Clostridia bacterium]
MPKTFDKFQDLKYNDVEKWNELKGFYRYKRDNLNSGLRDYKCAKELSDIGIKGVIHIPAKFIDINKLSFNDIHVNVEKNHNVSEEEAKEYITNAILSITKRQGLSENYYSKQGVSYVNPHELEIKTAFSSSEFKGDAKKIMEVIEKYGY